MAMLTALSHTCVAKVDEYRAELGQWALSVPICRTAPQLFLPFDSTDKKGERNILGWMP
jgi:hypothetical protein